MALIDHLLAHLLTHGPCDDTTLHAVLLDAGLTTAKTPTGVRSSLRCSRLTIELPDGRWDVLTRRLEGCVLTTRARSRLRDGVLWVHRDLEPFECLIPRGGLPLTGGGTVRIGRSDIRTLTGPEGWLPQVEPGQLISLRYEGGALTVGIAEEPPAADSEEVRRARALLGLHAVRRGRYYATPMPDLTAIVLSALQEDPDLLRAPLPPLSELVPLPDVEVGDLSQWDAKAESRALAVRLPLRVHDELCRRAELIGDRVDDYAGMLLGAVIDRVRPDTYPVYLRDSYRDSYREDDPDSYPDRLPARRSAVGPGQQLVLDGEPGNVTVLPRRR
jgi:hypothetical protein